MGVGIGIGWDVNGLMSGDSEEAFLCGHLCFDVNAWSYIFD